MHIADLAIAKQHLVPLLNISTIMQNSRQLTTTFMFTSGQMSTISGNNFTGNVWNKYHKLKPSKLLITSI